MDIELSIQSLVIENTFTALGLDKLTQTDPAAMCELLKETKLDTFKPTCPELKRFFKESQNGPQDLSKMQRLIKHGLNSNPVLDDFMKEGLKQKWFHNSVHFKKAIHLAYLLENLTFAGANSNTALTELQDHFHKKRKEYGINSKKVILTLFKLLVIYRNFFETAKTLSVNPFVTKYKLERENDGKLFTDKQLKKLKRKGAISFLEKAALTTRKLPAHMNNAPIQINILEAGISEFKKGFKDNALAAYALKQGCQKKEVIEYELGPVLPAGYEETEDQTMLSKEINYHPRNELSKEWVNLYSAWNLAFVFSELQDLHLLMPKLLLPSQIDAKPDQYIFNRALALDSVINFYLFRKLDHVTPVKVRPTKTKLLRHGEKSTEHALEYVQKELGKNPVEFEKEFEAYFAKGYRNLISMTKDFLTL